MELVVGGCRGGEGMPPVPRLQYLRDLQIHCRYSPIMCRQLSLSNCSAAAMDALLFIPGSDLLVGSGTRAASIPSTPEAIRAHLITQGFLVSFPD